MGIMSFDFVAMCGIFYWCDFWFGLRAIFFVNFVKFIYYENKIIGCIYNYNNIYLLLRILWF